MLLFLHHPEQGSRLKQCRLHGKEEGIKTKSVDIDLKGKLCIQGKIHITPAKMGNTEQKLGFSTDNSIYLHYTKSKMFVVMSCKSGKLFHFSKPHSCSGY